MEHALGNIFIRPNTLPKSGMAVPGHMHEFDHTTLVATGSINCKRYKRLFNDDGSPMLSAPDPLRPNAHWLTRQVWMMVDDRDFVRGQYFLVKAQERHDITALEDNTQFLCVYAHRMPQGDIVQSYTGWNPSYGTKIVDAHPEPSDGIKISPKMLDEGIDFLRAIGIDAASAPSVVSNIYRAMHRAAKG